MFFLSIPLKKDESFIRERIAQYIKYETTEISITGFTLYGLGLHFTENGEKIRGFYCSENEKSHTKSNARIYFSGAIVSDGAEKYFKGILHFGVVSNIFLPFAFASIIFGALTSKDVIGIGIATSLLFAFATLGVSSVNEAKGQVERFFGD